MDARSRVQNSSFTNISADNIFQAENGIVITDDLTGDAELQLDRVFRFEEGESVKTEPASALTNLDSDRIPPPGAADPWFVSLQEVRCYRSDSESLSILRPYVLGSL